MRCFFSKTREILGLSGGVTLIDSAKSSLFTQRALKTERQTDKRTDGQTDRQTGRQTYGRTDRQTDRQADIRTDRQTDRQTDIHTYRQTDRQAGRQTDRQTDGPTGRKTDRHTYKETDERTDRRTDDRRKSALNNGTHCVTLAKKRRDLLSESSGKQPVEYRSMDNTQRIYL